MKKLKIVLAVALTAACGAALAAMSFLYNPASVYNPATGHYEDGCGAATYQAWGDSTTWQIGPMLNGAYTYLPAGGGTSITCSSGTIGATGPQEGNFYPN